MPHTAACQSLERRVLTLLQFLLFFALQLCSNPLLLICSQKPGFLRSAWKQEVSQEARKRLRLFPLAKPVCEIQNDSREITRLSQAEQEPRNIQLMDAVHKTRQRGHSSPRNQNAGDPDAGS